LKCRGRNCKVPKTKDEGRPKGAKANIKSTKIYSRQVISLSPDNIPTRRASIPNGTFFSRPKIPSLKKINSHSHRAEWKKQNHLARDEVYKMLLLITWLIKISSTRKNFLKQQI